MNKVKKLLSAPATSIALFVVAVALLIGSTVGGVNAVLNITSETYESQIELYNIGVNLLENGKVVEGHDAMLTDFLGEDEELVPGKRYAEVLTASNTADIDEFVRVTVYKYWLDENGEKAPDMDPEWIQLGFVTDGGWTIDDASTTAERTVLYYGTAIAPGEETTPFMDSIVIDDVIMRKVTQTEEHEGNLTTITTTFDYDGVSFCISVSVDGVQTHHSEDAVGSAWGQSVSATEQTLTLR